MLPRSFFKIGIIFFILAIIVFGASFYLIWANVIILITPDTEKVSHEFVFKVKDPTTVTLENDEVPGKLKLVVVEGELLSPATGSSSVTSNIVGEVTVINNYSKEQKLISSTRLASESDLDTILVRLNKDITVAPGEKVKVQVYTDDINAFKELEPMRFIIPGLWGPLQEKIYAQSEINLSKDNIKVSVVTAEDLKKAEDNLRDQLYQKSLLEVNQQLTASELLWPKLVSAKIIELKHDVEAGKEAAEFKTTIKLEAAIVVFDENLLINLAKDSIRTTMTIDQAINLDPASFVYLVESYSFEKNEATVKVNFDSSLILSDVSKFLDKGELAGKTEEEVIDYLKKFDQIKSVEVKFQPAWLKKTPQFKGKIKLEIAE